jgi:hypothetical protein
MVQGGDCRYAADWRRPFRNERNFFNNTTFPTERVMYSHARGY